jgi:hypothetical protein
MPTTNVIDTQDLDRIERMLSDRTRLYEKAFGQVSATLSKLGIKTMGGIVDLGASVMNEGLRQLRFYEDSIVDVFGDITTQQETFGKSVAKLSFERVQELQEDFLQMEAGGIRVMDVFENYSDAAQHALEIIGNLPGATGQFTDDLEKQNLTIIQLLSKASGLAAEQTTAIMKIAKGRQEDSKQMLADIGTFSKSLADKFGLDMKDVARSITEITTMTSTFGKVSIETAAAAAAKFEALGVSIDDVAGSIGSTFGSFSGAADAASKLSQVFGVNIDAMQMMVDVNSGPEGMLSALDNLRESLIGAGVDASELSAPLRRLIKEMTGVSDDATIESLFDPDRITMETDEIIDAAKKAAESQKKAPQDAIKFLDQDIAKVHRSMSDLEALIDRQTLARLGSGAVNAAKSFSGMSSEIANATDKLNQLLVQSEKLGVKGALQAGLLAVEGAGKVATSGARAVGAGVEKTAAIEGLDIKASRPVDFGDMMTPNRGVLTNEEYIKSLGITLTERARKRDSVEDAILELENAGMTAFEEKITGGNVSEQTKARIGAAGATFMKAAQDMGMPVGVVAAILGEAEAAEPQPQTPSLTPGPYDSESFADIAEIPSVVEDVAGGEFTSVSPAGQVVAVPPAAPPAIPVVPAAPAPASAPAAPAAPGAAPSESTVSRRGPVTAATPVGGTPVGTFASNSSPNTNITITIEAGALSRVLAEIGGVAVT